jgi:hypothetical protein
MAVSYLVATKNNRLKMVFLSGAVTPATGEAVDVGGAGKLVIGTSALSGGTGVLATLTLPVPSVSISAGVATLNGVPLTANASATNTAAKAEFRNSADTTIISGLTVGVSASDINLSTTALVSGSPVTITAGTITHPV